MLSKLRKRPEEVFTPRSTDVNDRMYVCRPDLEESLQRALRGTQHILIHGESGSGKSWLYKRVFSQTGVRYIVVNLANAAHFGSITEAIRNTLAGQEKSKKIGYSEEKSAEVNTLVAKGALKHTGNFDIGQKEPLEACLADLSRSVGDSTRLLVFDNLEAIVRENKLMGELGNIILLLDDEVYSQYKVRILLVGVPAGVKDYYGNIENRSTVSNRIQEIPEVARLDIEQVRTLVNRGFAEELGYKLEPSLMATVVDHVWWVTIGVPQRVHEYCLSVASAGEPERTLKPGSLELADWDWLKQSLWSSYEAIYNAMNDRQSTVGRRNQVLYSLAKSDEEAIRVAEIEEIHKAQFPQSSSGRKLNTSQILSDLASREPPIIRRSAKGNEYIFSDPRYRMCMRAMLRKNPDETVRAVNLGSI